MMSDWDFGRAAAGHFEVPRPPRLDGSTYPYPLPFPLPQALEDDDEAQPAARPPAPGASARPPAPGAGGPPAPGAGGPPAPGAGGRPDIGRPPWDIADTAPYPW